MARSVTSAESGSLKNVDKSEKVQVRDIKDDDSSRSDEPERGFGGPEARRHLERKLLRKLDARMSILVVIYILNYVSICCATHGCQRGADPSRRLTATMPGTTQWLNRLYVER